MRPTHGLAMPKHLKNRESSKQAHSQDPEMITPLFCHVVNGQSQRSDLVAELLQPLVLAVLCPGRIVVLPDNLRS